MATTTTKPADKAQAEAAAKAALAKKREEAELAAKIEEYRRDVPPGIGEVEAELPLPFQVRDTRRNLGNRARGRERRRACRVLHD